MQAVEYTLDDQSIILSNCQIVLLIFTNCHSFKKWAVISRQHFLLLAIVLCQIHVQAVEYVLDDQMINSEQVWGSIVNLH